MPFPFLELVFKFQGGLSDTQPMAEGMVWRAIFGDHTLLISVWYLVIGHWMPLLHPSLSPFQASLSLWLSVPHPCDFGGVNNKLVLCSFVALGVGSSAALPTVGTRSYSVPRSTPELRAGLGNYCTLQRCTIHTTQGWVLGPWDCFILHKEEGCIC